jgi:CRP-like cAMP-binding protein
MPEDIFAFLKKSDLCKGCSDQEILDLKSYMEVLELGGKEILFKKGDFADAFYLIAKGAVEIRLSQASHEEVIATLGENTVLGEVGILTDQMRSATAAVTKPAVLLKLSRSTFEKLLSEGKPVAYKLVYQIAKILSYRLRQMDEAMMKLTNHSGPSHEMNQLRAKLQADWPF